MVANVSNDQKKPAVPILLSSPAHVLIVIAKFYHDISEELLQGALACLKQNKTSYDLLEVPGAFEIPAAIHMALAASDYKSNQLKQKIEGSIALGCVIRGETSHYDYVCGESARGLQQIACQQLHPLGNGILTVENKNQAWDRAKRNKQNKGGEAASACLSMIMTKRRLFQDKK